MKHLHKYKRMTMGAKYKVLKCIVPGCPHYVPLNNMAIGRICECNRCEKPMTLTKASLRLAKPHCEDCVERQDDSRKIEERIKNLGL